MANRKAGGKGRGRGRKSSKSSSKEADGKVTKGSYHGPRGGAKRQEKSRKSPGRSSGGR